MTGLTLIGLNAEGTHLVVQDTTGQQSTLLISDELRRMVRNSTSSPPSSPEAAPQAANVPSSSLLSPREIQQRLRAGLTPGELAELTGEQLAAIEKFAAPVMAERQYVIDQARSTRIGRDSGAPVLDDLVQDRLASRGVDPASLTWEAWRVPQEPWRVALDFRADGHSVRAVWTYDHTARSLTSEDEEARWLTETELLDAPIRRRHLSAVRPTAPLANAEQQVPETVRAADRVMSDGQAPSAAIPMPHPSELRPTEALLEELDSKRGTREVFDVEEEDEPEYEAFEGFGPAARARGGQGSFVSASSPSSAASPAESDATGPADVGNDVSPPTPARGEKKPRKGRASVPSWDEIVFGAKSGQQDKL